MGDRITILPNGKTESGFGVTWRQPTCCNYPIAGLPWETAAHEGYAMSCQWVEFLNNHLQLFELVAREETAIRFRVPEPTIFAIIVLEGFVRFRNGNDFISYAMRGTYYVSYNTSGELTAMVSEGKHSVLGVAYDDGWISRAEHGLPALSPIIAKLRSKSEELQLLPMCRMDRNVMRLWEMLETLTTDPFHRVQVLTDLAYRVAAMYTAQLDRGKVLANLPSVETANTIFMHVERHYTSDQMMTLSNIANMLNLPEWRVRSYTITLFGMTLHKYVRILRMNEAARLLRDTDMSANEISLEVGFSIYHYFYTTFKDFFGETPRNYRKRS